MSDRTATSFTRSFWKRQRNLLLLLAVLVVAVGTARGIEPNAIDSLLAEQRSRAGDRAPLIFDGIDPPRESGITADERADLRFLLASLPLSDLAALDGETLLENVRWARRAREAMPWGGQLSDDLYRHFVLPHRVSQEPFVHGWRERFYEELAARVQKMSMTEAALEVNHWCHEQATYQSSDGRDQDPLTTMRAGLGRCEEEMILAICALRSVGIPARQCYTPYWAHMDDNHAWVEAWADGKWHYFGACEPEPVLDRGWFTKAATRAMLVVSTAYGDYRGDEPVLKRYGRTTLINSTAVYGSPRELTVSLLDEHGQPRPGQKVFFSLFNYGTINPALSLDTDDKGDVQLVCGRGTWLVSAGSDQTAALAVIDGKTDDARLKLGPAKQLTALTDVEYVPPPESSIPDTVKRDSLFECRVRTEDTLRENLWSIWATEARFVADDIPPRPDSVAVYSLAAAHDLDGKRLFEIFQKARGNWGHLYFFLIGYYPGVVPNAHVPRPPNEIKARFAVLDNLTDKDLRDFTVETLEDHFQHHTREGALQSETIWEPYTALDSVSRQRYSEHVIAPRLQHEPSTAWRRVVGDFFSGNRSLVSSKNDKVLLRWLKKHIVIEKEKDRLGPPLTPAQTLALRRGSQRDVELLYAGLCRVRGIPARFNPVTDQLERWGGEKWIHVPMAPAKEKPAKPRRQGQLIIEAASTDSTIQTARYYQDWAVARWDKDHFTDVDFGYKKPFREQTWPQELPVGTYCLSSGFRRDDGSAAVKMTWLEILPGTATTVTLDFRAK